MVRKKVMTVMRWYAQDEVNQEDSEQNEVGLNSALRPRQHSIGYFGRRFYRSKDPTKCIKVLKKNQPYNNQIINTKHSKSPSLHYSVIWGD